MDLNAPALSPEQDAWIFEAFVDSTSVDSMRLVPDMPISRKQIVDETKKRWPVGDLFREYTF